MNKLADKLLERIICQTLLDSELDAFIVADDEGKIVFWNAAAENMFGHSREYAIGHYIHKMIVPENMQERAIAAFAHFHETGTGSFVDRIVEIEALHRSGHLFPVEISLNATQVDGAWFSQAIVRSISRRKEIESEVQRLSTTDPLTGIYNRGSMFGHGKRELSRAIRYGHSLSLVIVEIDQLKKINESSGHSAGDQVIRSLANFLSEGCRYSDVLGRISGVKILLLLPETGVSVAAMVAEKWCVAIRKLTDNVDDERVIPFTCSIGVTSFTNEDRFDILLRKVETNLQQAKSSGGNKVVSTAEF